MRKHRGSLLLALTVLATALFSGEALAQNASADDTNNSNNPLNAAPGLNFQDYYTPDIYGSDKYTNDFLLRGAANAASNFSMALVVLGVLFLIAGIWNHISHMRELRRERQDLITQGFIHGQSAYPFSLTLGTAIALVLLGLVVIMGMLMRAGPFN